VKIEIRDSLLKDIKKIAKKDKEKLEYIYNQFLNAENINEIQNIKKLKGFENFHRLRVGNYRLGFLLEKDKIVFLRFLHRKDIYKYFP
jgi:mRNA interferase RelE/StbE